MQRPEPTALIAFGAASLEVRPAVSFWPLLGDAALLPPGGARLVDSSARRLQLVVSAPQGAPLGEIGVNGWKLPLHRLPGDQAPQPFLVGLGQRLGGRAEMHRRGVHAVRAEFGQ